MSLSFFVLQPARWDLPWSKQDQLLDTAGSILDALQDGANNALSKR